MPNTHAGGAGGADLNYRQRQLIGTTAEWARCDIVLGLGEIGVEQAVDGVKIKIGDGGSKFSSLPYVTGSGGGAVYVGSTAPATKAKGDMWFDPTTGRLSVFDGTTWVAILDNKSKTPWTIVSKGIQYNEVGKNVAVGNMPGTPQKFNVEGNSFVSGTMLGSTVDVNQVTGNHADIKSYNGGVMTLTGHFQGTTGTYTGAVHADELWVDGQKDSTGGSTQVPALLGPTGQIIRGAHVVFGQIIRDTDKIERIRFTSAKGSNYDINMMGQMVTGLPDAAAHPDAYNMFGPGGSVVAESAASIRWVENKFGGITGMNFRGAKDVIKGGDAPPTTFKANDWYIVRNDSYDDKGALVGLMSDAWWDLLTPYSKLARTDEDGKQMREVFAGDHLIWADTPNPANAGFAYIENSNHHNRFISRFGDKMAGVLTLLKRTSNQNQRPITYAGHGFNFGCFGGSFVSDNVTYSDGNILSLNSGGGNASMIEFLVNDGNGTRYHQLSMAGNGSIRLPVSGAAYQAPGSGMLQQKNVHMGAHVSSDGANEIAFIAKHDNSLTRKTFRARFTVRGTGSDVIIEPTGIINGVSPGVSMNSVVVLSQLQNFLDKSKAGGLHTLNQGLDMNNFKILNVQDPVNPQDPVTLKYFQQNGVKYNFGLHIINCQEPVPPGAAATNCRLVNVADAVNPQDALTLAQFTRKQTATSAGSASAGKIVTLDGTGKISASMLPAGLQDGMHIKGAVAPTAAPPAHQNGDAHFVSVGGNLHAGYGLGAIHVNAGDMLVFAGGKWHVVANEVDLSAFYTKAQSDAKFELKGAAYTRAQSDAKFEIKGAAYTTAQSNAKFELKGAVHGVPAGGSAGQVLAKTSSTNYATHWINPPAPASAGMQIKGAVSPTASPPAHSDGDIHFIRTGGTLNTGYGLGAITVNAGDMLLYANRKWHIIANEADLSGYLPLTGGDIRGSTQVHANFTAWGNFTVSGLAMKTSIQSKTVDITGTTVLHSDTNVKGAFSTEGATNDFGGNADFHKNVIVRGGINMPSSTGTLNVQGKSYFHSIMDLGRQKIENVGTPTNPNDAATKAYVDAHAGGGTPADMATQTWVRGQNYLTERDGDRRYLERSGGSMSGNIDMNHHQLIDLKDPTGPQTAVTLHWFNTHAANTASDRKLKKNIQPLTEGLDVIDKINTYTYEYNQDNMPSGVKRGVIADEMATVLPDLVVENDDFLGVDYQQLIPVLINAVKELKAEIAALKTEKAHANSN